MARDKPNMPLKIVRKNHVDIPGRGFVLLTTPHATGLGADPYMGQIVEDAALLAKSFAVIGKASKEFADPSTIQLARSELKDSIQIFLQENQVRCVLDIRCKMEPGVRLGSGRESASESTQDIIKSRLAKDFTIDTRVEDQNLDPAGLAASFSKEGPDGNFVLETIWIEFSLEEKTLNPEKIIRGLSDVVGLVNLKVGYSESDEGASNVLD